MKNIFTPTILKRSLLLSVVGSSLLTNPVSSQTYTALSTGMSAGVYSLAYDSAKSLIYAGGDFIKAGGGTVNHASSWNGTTWAYMGMNMGTDYSMIGTNDTIQSMVMWGGKLYAGGAFTTAYGSAAGHIAQWSGTMAWTGWKPGMNGNVRALAVYKGALYAAGSFTDADGATVSNIAMLSSVSGSWAAVGNGLNGEVEVLQVYNGKLYAGGHFTSSGSTTVNHVAAWDGTNWTALGGGCTTTSASAAMVHAMTVHNGALYIGGMFSSVNGSTATNIAKWDGTNWSAVGSIGTSSAGSIEALASYKGALIAGGTFSTADGNAINNIAMWNGSAWYSLGGVNGPIHAFCTTSASLYIGGVFTMAGTTVAANIVKLSALPPLSVNQLDKKTEGLVVYPNPTTNALKFALDIPNGDYNLCVSNLVGQIVYSSKINVSGQYTGTLDVSSYEKGAYFLSVKGGNATLDTKVLVY